MRRGGGFDGFAVDAQSCETIIRLQRQDGGGARLARDACHVVGAARARAEHEGLLRLRLRFWLFNGG